MARDADQAGRLWVESGELQRAWVARVAPIVPVERTYSFVVPPELVGAVKLGQRVEVPMGKAGGRRPGFVVDLAEQAWDSTLRPIAGVLDAETFLTPSLIELGRRISQHYACPLGRTLKAMTPQGVRAQRGLATVRYAALTAAGSAAVAEPATDGVRLTPQRRQLLEALALAGEAVRVPALLERAGVSAGVLRGLASAGLVEIAVRKELPDEPADTARQAVEEPGFVLNDAQTAALSAVRDRLSAGGFSVTLLHGVSGSGKTEVYVRAMQKVIARGQQALLLVPEIVLTTQLVSRLAARFPTVAVAHSGLSDAERAVQWRQIARGERTVVIGTRSAVFAPCPQLGLICVDEEQESSYKNLQAPRFHVRDVAVMRAHLEGVPVVLGSATPSLETWHNCIQRDHYHCVTLATRVRELPLPEVYIVDMRHQPPIDNKPPLLSDLLEDALRATLLRREQAVILVNRRGYAHHLFCTRCGQRIVCPRCNVGMVLHAVGDQVMCHYCHSHTPAPTRCPDLNCQGPLARAGAGTQRVEDVLAKRLPEARIVRADSDAIRRGHEYQRLIDTLANHEADILVGTQMIAKGLDFPLVSLVGVLRAEPSALASDFRAQERLFQLISQVAGRAGRATAGGMVIVQTTTPEVPALRSAVKHDYVGFARQELAARERMHLPPFVRLARVVLTHAREQTVAQAAAALAQSVHEQLPALKLPRYTVLGPAPCSMLRLRGKYRYELLLRTPAASQLHQLLQTLRRTGVFRKAGAAWQVDVDPVELA